MPDPTAALAGGIVNVYVPKDVAFDLAKMNKITADVLGRLGCPGCHSGRILHFKSLEDFVVNANLQVQEINALGVK